MDLVDIHKMIEDPQAPAEAILLGKALLSHLASEDDNGEHGHSHADAAQDGPLAKGLSELVATMKRGQDQAITALVAQGHDELLAELETSCKWAGAVDAGKEVAAALKTWREADRPDAPEASPAEPQVIFTP